MILYLSYKALRKWFRYVSNLALKHSCLHSINQVFKFQYFSQTYTTYGNLQN
jgi:hypothetical protein